MLKSIIRLQLSRIQKRVLENQGVPLTYDDAVIDLIASRCTELESGGRMVDAILTQTLLPEISREFLNRMLEGQTPARVQIGVKDANFTYTFV
jgi:type VI secretion system protein VasG